MEYMQSIQFEQSKKRIIFPALFLDLILSFIFIYLIYLNVNIFSSEAKKFINLLVWIIVGVAISLTIIMIDLGSRSKNIKLYAIQMDKIIEFINSSPIKGIRIQGIRSISYNQDFFDKIFHTYTIDFNNGEFLLESISEDYKNYIQKLNQPTVM